MSSPSTKTVSTPQRGRISLHTTKQEPKRLRAATRRSPLPSSAASAANTAAMSVPVERALEALEHVVGVRISGGCGGGCRADGTLPGPAQEDHRRVTVVRTARERLSQLVHERAVASAAAVDPFDQHRRAVD